ncbi:MAG: hypothetical protein LBU70_10575 [Chitinispirillales bacterium]|jgi:hypothetical protein|nr:hypothetical protein [Chitinispirillales bacterium]
MIKIKNYIAERGFSVMLCGMLTAVVGVVGYMYFQSYPARFEKTPLPTVTVVLAFTGLAIYVIGRVSLAIQRNRARKRPPADDDE